VTAIDEIGPMELFSDKFKEAVKRAVEGEKLVICVVHWKAKDKLIDDVKKREDAALFEVTYENRDSIHEAVVAKAIEFLAHTSKAVF
jgi:nucleoside-triphosphatase